MNTVHTITPMTQRGEYDVIVVGGGLAGCAAAIAASREGARVLLCEKHGYLGGMATAGLVHPFMTYYERGSGVPCCAGIFKKLLENIYDLGGSSRPGDQNYMEEFMKLALDRMCIEAGVKLLFHAQLYEVERDGEVIKSISVNTVQGNLKLSAPVFIDATGDADLTAFAGLEYKLGRDLDGLCQPMTMCFRLGNVDWSRFDNDYAQKLYKEKQAKGELRNPRENLLLFHMPVDNIMHLNTTRIFGKNPVDAYDYSDSELESREQVYEMYRFMKDDIPGMENCVLTASAAETGIRESRRIVGHYEITEDDILGVRKFDDRIARGTYDVDIHNPAGSGTVIKHIPNNDYYTIPYRALIPLKADNLIIAGRPVSSTHEAHSSFRIMPITTCMGEAAGVAAYFAYKSDSRFIDADITKIQNTLTDRGALI